MRVGLEHAGDGRGNLEVCVAVLLGVIAALLFSWSKRLTLLVFPLPSANMIRRSRSGHAHRLVQLRHRSNMLITFSLCFFPILLTTVRGLRESSRTCSIWCAR
jgi:NitT/TauT family transport system permease protein